MSKKPLIEIYTYTDGINDTPFPNKENPLVIPEYAFSDKRMGSATLTATAMYPRCLDDDWVLGKQYAVLRGQKYFINKTPSSSKSNDDVRYKHQIEFTPHRAILDNIYFYDVVIGAADRYVSNSTKVTFFGNVHEFAARINSSLTYSKTGYTVVVDAGISSEEKMVTLENQFISNVLQEIFNIYELPFYFSGTEIHIGYTNNAITHTFKYGHDYELLSISKQNANYKITNRVTGTGSTENIPFYYPNPSNNRIEIEEAGGSWITPSANLMPPIYRDSNGGERFYNAKNNRYVNPDTGEFYQFENEYSENNPKEQIVSFNDIKPTIKEVYNDLYQRIDLISDVEFDDDDNNEVDANGNFLHPYFYVKLRKFGNGDQGFNLFAQALVGSDAVVAFTSGACSPGNFPIMVTKSIRDGETHFSNPVQVDEHGEIVSGNYEKKINTGNLITEQQDTRTNEVWIALQKETETYGISIPNKAQNITPKQGDSFVFLHISMPEYYITQAEEKLRQAIIKYMAANNAEKFTFQIKLSRIFLTENPDVADLIDSNARIDLEYNGQRHQLYVNSYTYKSDKEILPEITLDLTDTLAINKNSLQTAIDSVKQDIMNSIGSQDFLKQGLKYFIRKDVSDYANGRITFNDGLRVYGREAGARNPGGSFIPDINSKVWLETDYLTVRIKAYFEALEIVHMNSVGGRVIITPAGSIKCTAVEDREDLLDENGNKIGETVWDYYRCYFLEEQDGIKVENRFKKGDQAMSEDFNIQEGVYEGVSNHYYWRLVVGIGSNYIDLSKGDCDTGSDAPQIGDVICQLGYRYNDDPQRQNAMIFSAVDLYAPAVTLYNGIDSYSYREKDYISYGVDKTNNKAYSYCYGDSYVGDRARTSYMEFVQGRGVKIKGQLEIGSTIGDGSTIEDALDKAKQDAIAAANENLTNYANQVARDIAEIQNQIDGQIESFFEKHNPTLTNYPAVDWVTEEQKQQHANDTFTNIETGESWRWQKNGEVWEWGVISDTATQKALALAAKAQDTADGKRRIFVRQPKDSEAVDIGDLWVNATYGNIYKNDILRAIVEKEAGVAFNINQWELASKYTDDTKAQEAQDAADKAQAEADAAKARLDKWAEDGIISPTEKQGLKDEIARIKADKDNIEAGYVRYKLGNPEGFLNAYADYLAVLTTLSAPEPEEIEIPTDFATKQTKYYDERTDALETIAAATKSLIDAAEAIANAAKDRLEEWAKDGVISPVEKQGIKDEIVRIDADNIDINNKYTLYSLGVPTMYIRAYDTYRLNLEALCKETPENIPIPSDFAAIQTSYYNARTAAYKAIDEAAKKLSVDAMEAAKKAQEDIDATKEDVNALKGDVAGLKDFTDEAFKDGIIDRSEYAAIQAYIKNIQTIQADVTKNYSEVYNNPLLAGIAKSQLKTSYDAFNAAVNELLTAIQEVIVDEKVTASERAVVDAKYDVFNTKYGDFIAYLTAANTYIQDQINAKAQSALDELLTFKPVKDAFLEKTLIQGGVILSSFMALGYTKPATDTYEIMSGVNGVYDATAIGGGIAAWYGGNMKDRDSFPADAIPEDAAKAVIRMDGSGYLADGAVWWGLDGKFHANPNSFLIEENQLGDYLKLFQIIYLDKDKHIIDYIIPQYPMQNLEVANNLTVGGNIRLKDGILRWDADNKAFWVEMWDGSVAGFYATSYVSAKGARTGGGGGGGVVSTVYGYTDLGGTFADSDKNNTFNAYTIDRLASRITTLEEGGSGLSSITVKLGTTAYDSVDGVVSLPAYPVTLPASDVYAWAKASTKPTYTFAEIASKPTTLAGYGITDAVSSTTLNNYVTLNTAQIIDGAKVFSSETGFTNGDRAILISGNQGVLKIIGGTGGWANGVNWIGGDKSTVLFNIGAYGSNNSFEYGYLGLSYENYWWKYATTYTYTNKTLVVCANGTLQYNEGIRINRPSADKWALLTIGYTGTSATATSANTWLIGTPANSNDLIFNNNGSNANTGLCLKATHPTDGLKWNNNTVLHAANYNNYAPSLTGTKASGTWSINITGESAYLKIGDKRDAIRYPDFFRASSVTGFFNQTGMPISAYWFAGIHVKGWSDSYYSWELVSGSNNNTGSDAESLYTRTGTNASWGAWRRIADSSNIPVVFDANPGHTLKSYYCDGTTKENSGLWNTIKVNTQDLKVYFYDVYRDGGPTTYGDMMEIIGRSRHWQPQIWFDAESVGSVRHRNKNYNNETWGDWHVFLDTLNISNYGSLLKPTWVNVTNKITNTNEFNFLPSNYSQTRVWFNYRAETGGSISGEVTQYMFGNGKNVVGNTEVVCGSLFRVGNDATASTYGRGIIELYSTTPYIDFHFGNSTGDYTSRIIEQASGRLDFTGFTLFYKTVYFGTLSTYINNTGSAFLAHTAATGTGNVYNTLGLETRGGGIGSTVYPGVGFHQPGAWAASLQLRVQDTFYFRNQGDTDNARVVAYTYHATVPQGTAPFNVVSATKVNNLNVDLLDGYHGSANIDANTYVLRTGQGYIQTSYIYCSTPNSESSNPVQFITTNGSDNYYRKVSYGQVRSFLYAHDETLDLRSLDSNTWYPCSMTLSSNTYTTIRIWNSLKGNKPSWATHANGFTLNLIWSVTGGGWGTTDIQRTIQNSHYQYTELNPCGGIKQNTMGSTEIVYLRGGALYYYWTSDNRAFTINPSGYSWTSGSYSYSAPNITSPDNNPINQYSYSVFGVSELDCYDANVSHDLKVNGTFTTKGDIVGNRIGIANTSSTTGYGVSLYNGNSVTTNGMPTYGIAFAGTGTFGLHGYIQGDWATYLTMDNTPNRGWIFRRGTTNVASINGGGSIYLSGSGYVNYDFDVSRNLGVGGTLSVSSTSTFTGRATFSIGLYAGGYNNSTYDMSTGSFICNSWVRTVGASGWYSESYGGGIHMQDSTYVRVYNGKKFYVSNTSDANASDAAISTSGGLQTTKGIWCGGYLTINGQDKTTNGSGIFLTSSYDQRIGFKRTDYIWAHIDFIKNPVSWSPYTNIQMNIQAYGDIQINSANGNKALWIGSQGVGTNANIWSDGAITAKKSSSDIRLKKDLTEYSALEIIKKHRSVMYHWNDTAKANAEVFRDDSWQFGLIAQDLISNGYKQLTSDIFHDFYTVEYERLTPICWRGIQELDDRQTQLERRVEKLEQIILSLGGSIPA